MALRRQHDFARQRAGAAERIVFLQAVGGGSLGEVHDATDLRCSLSRAIQRLISAAHFRCSSAGALNIAKPSSLQFLT